jgi:hypothetical protein
VTPPDMREDRVYFTGIGESLPDIGRSEARWRQKLYV